MHDVSCIILAGGEGRRMGGQDKGLVDYLGRPMIEHALKAVKPQVDDVVISANRNIETYQRYTDRVTRDSSSAYLGPLAGIAACLVTCKHADVLVVACDMPGLPADLVSRLQACSCGKDIAIASVAGHMQLAMLIKKRLADSIIEQLDTGNRMLRQWVRSCDHAICDFDDAADAFTNVNQLPAD